MLSTVNTPPHRLPVSVSDEMNMNEKILAAQNNALHWFVAWRVERIHGDQSNTWFGGTWRERLFGALAVYPAVPRLLK
jgi:hypothetical protein